MSKPNNSNAYLNDEFQNLDLPKVKLNSNKTKNLIFHLTHPELWKHLDFLQFRSRRMVAVLLVILTFLLFILVVSPSDPMAEFLGN